MMNPTKYIYESSRTDGDDQFYEDAGKRYSECARLLHYTLGLAGESGEIVDAVKKHVQYGAELDKVNIKEEIGDCLWFIANLCRLFDWSMEEIMQLNIDKLKLRYPDKFTFEKSKNRDKDAERELLESGE